MTDGERAATRGVLGGPGPGRPGFGVGLAWALVSAASFGTSGTLASGLITAGWTPALAVTLRITIGAAALLLPTVGALRGRWALARANARTVALYGVLAVALPQTCFFFAVQRLPVGPALLIEYVSPLVVLGWLWVVHRQPPTRLMLAGTAVAMVGLLLVLGLTTAEPLDPIGVLWAAGGLIGAASFFLLSARPDTGLPPIVLAGGGLTAGAALLWTLGLTGVLPFAAGADTVRYGGVSVPAWVGLAAVGLVAGALAYSAGIAASRRLGSRLASFAGLSEVVLAFGYAWLLLGQVPGPTQVAGAVLILAGVTLLKLGEPAPA